jgi:hypothetical protein
LKLFREKGGRADPVFGSHRKPEGVILSYERYEWQTEILDELVASEEVFDPTAKQQLLDLPVQGAEAPGA